MEEVSLLTLDYYRTFWPQVFFIKFHAPYTLEKTGMVEKRHKIIHEWGKTMLFHSSAPLSLWVEAFATSMFLINWLPSSSIHFDTPYFMLHGTHPDYTSFRVFGYKCFPYTWNTRNHNFDPKTILCVFVGYCEKHKGYKCFHPPSRNFFIFRHVVFYETVFPFKSSSFSTSAEQVLNIFDTWIPSSKSFLGKLTSPRCQHQ